MSQEEENILPNVPSSEAPVEVRMEVPITPPRPEQAWGYTEIALVLLGLIISEFLCAAAGVALAKILPGSAHLSLTELAKNPLFFVPVRSATYLLTFAVMWLAVRTKADRRFSEAIHWSPPRPQDLIGYVGIGVVTALTILSVSRFLPIPPSLPMQQYFRETRFVYMMAVFGLLLAPLAEELFFRGLLFPVLRRTMGTVAGVFCTAATFAMIHGPQLAWAWAPLLVLLAVGLMLTMVRARANSVAASWITHVAYNGTLFGVLFYFSNGFRNLGR